MRRHLIVVISAVTGVCFAALAGQSIAEMAFPVRQVHLITPVLAIVSGALGYAAFRAAIAGETDAEALAAALHGGMLGALVGVVAIILLVVMFQDATHAFFAHAVGKRSSIFSDYSLLAAGLLLGFGTGFVVRVPRERSRN